MFEGNTHTSTRHFALGDYYITILFGLKGTLLSDSCTDGASIVFTTSSIVSGKPVAAHLETRPKQAGVAALQPALSAQSHVQL